MSQHQNIEDATAAPKLVKKIVTIPDPTDPTGERTTEVVAFMEQEKEPGPQKMDSVSTIYEEPEKPNPGSFRAAAKIEPENSDQEPMKKMFVNISSYEG